MYTQPVLEEKVLSQVPDLDRAIVEPRWYATYTRANHEKVVAQHLEGRAIECFVPAYESVRRWKDRNARLRRPLFPGYVFVRLALQDKMRVLKTPGVVQLVGFNGQPTSVPPEEIESIRTCLTHSYRMSPHPYLQHGQRIRVLSGPLAGITGVVERQTNGARFIISVDLLMRSVAVEVDSSDLDFRVIN